MTIAYVGIDVQSQRGCPYVVLGSDLKPRENGWLVAPEDALPIAKRLREQFGRLAVGIDAPRSALPSPREHYWADGAWRPRKAAEKGFGRHCEVVLKALGIANPQWTPTMAACHEWMKVGFRLFAVLSEAADVYEVFPSAAYVQLAKSKHAFFTISLEGFARGPKDMLDAYVAAYTVSEYVAGRGAAVGGGDGLGEIILPRRLGGEPTAVFRWPKHGGERPSEREGLGTRRAKITGHEH